LKIGIVTRNVKSWSSTQLRDSLTRHSIPFECFSFPQIVARVGCKPVLKVGSLDIQKDLDVLLVRPIGRGSLEELVFRMDILYRLERLGFRVINSPESIEHCVDKYDTLAILEENGIPVPKTAVTENVDEALEAFSDLGSDVVVKPIFGSRGVGATRIIDPEIAATALAAVSFHHGVAYIQEFVNHGYSDIRAFVVGKRVVASMRRVAKSWKTNYSQGARPEPFEVDHTLEETAVKSARSIDCEIAGIDILEGSDGPVVVDINSQPGWRGLQSVTTVNIADEIVDFVASEMRK
jgi:RimK family alpha-L-glutamate ligase